MECWHSPQLCCVVSRVLRQIIRRLLHFGIPELEHPSVEPLFSGLLRRMQSVLGALEQHQAKCEAPAATAAGNALGRGSGEGGEGEGRILGELQELAERMACTAVDAQEDHPIGFRRYVHCATINGAPVTPSRTSHAVPLFVPRII